MEKIRLHKYLTNLISSSTQDSGLFSLHNFTRNEIQKNIEKHGVMLNKRLVYQRLTWVTGLDEISITHWPQPKKPELLDIKVLFETQSALVLFKPKGLVVQPGAAHQHDNLLNWLLSNYPGQKELQSLPADLYDNHKQTAGLVHRLDKNTQGVLLVAKTLPDLRFFQDQFRNRTTQKFYLALLNGVLQNGHNVEMWQTRDNSNPIRQKGFFDQQQALLYHPQARYSHSIIQPVLVCKELNQTLVKVHIKTGRMHQIRLHAESIGFPLFNDDLYCLNQGFSPKIILNTKIPAKYEIFSKNSEEFKSICKTIFSEYDYGLLSNQLIIQQQDGTYLDVEIFNSDTWN